MDRVVDSQRDPIKSRDRAGHRAGKGARMIPKESAACDDGGDAPRAERRIPAEHDTLHHTPETESELLHQSPSNIKPDLHTDA